MAAERDLAVQLHPAMETMHWTFQDWGLNAAFGTLVSSTTTVARMVLSGMFDQVPNLAPIVPHLGGAIPFVAARISEMGRGTAKHDLLYHCRSTLYFDNCSFHPPALRATIDVAGADRIMLGSDYPGRGPLQRCIQDVLDSGLSPIDQQRILGDTAARWFALERRST